MGLRKLTMSLPWHPYLGQQKSFMRKIISKWNSLIGKDNETITRLVGFTWDLNKIHDAYDYVPKHNLL